MVCMRGICVRLAGTLLLGLAVTGCNTSKEKRTETGKTAFAAEQAGAPPASSFLSGGPRGSLAGRTLRVGSISDIKLRKGEVVLTFDDGPMPGRTDAVLAALRTYGVKATFLMVGSMARAHPATARKVAASGHTIGTHTQNHANLARLGADRAAAEINEGQKSVAAALIPTGYRPAPFFRFPYLADTGALRSRLASQGVVVIDVNVDSNDYFPSAPGQVKSRTMARLKARGSGIILFHDIHARTGKMLPQFLEELAANGFSVVHLVPGRGTGSGDLISSLETEGSFAMSYETGYAMSYWPVGELVQGPDDRR